MLTCRTPTHGGSAAHHSKQGTRIASATASFTSCGPLEQRAQRRTCPHLFQSIAHQRRRCAGGAAGRGFEVVARGEHLASREVWQGSTLMRVASLSRQPLPPQSAPPHKPRTLSPLTHPQLPCSSCSLALHLQHAPRRNTPSHCRALPAHPRQAAAQSAAPGCRWARQRRLCDRTARGRQCRAVGSGSRAGQGSATREPERAGKRRGRRRRRRRRRQCRSSIRQWGHSLKSQITADHSTHPLAALGPQHDMRRRAGKLGEGGERPAAANRACIDLLRDRRLQASSCRS